MDTTEQVKNAAAVALGRMRTGVKERHSPGKVKSAIANLAKAREAKAKKFLERA